MPQILKNSEHELAQYRGRLAFLVGMVFLCFVVLTGRFVYLQIIKQQHYANLAEQNRVATIPIPPARGVITDRNGVVLATDDSSYTIELTPSKIINLETTIDAVAKLIDITPRDRRRFKKLLEETKNFESLPLRSRLSDAEVAKLAAHRFQIAGMEIKARAYRQYPFGETASHVLGYISRISQADQERIKARGESTNYKGTEYMGKVGVELSYEQELHGTTGAEEVEVDAAGRAVRVLSRKAPVAGNNLRLSLDIKLQQVAEQAFGNKRGALVAIEPATGDILAFVSKPGYDPNMFVDGIDPQNWDLLNNSPEKPLLNRPLRGAYPPGSTYKPFMALAALEMGLRTPTQSISDPGYYMLANHRFNDDKVGGHGHVDMAKSIVVSCDTYYYRLAYEMDIDDLAKFMQQFSFGRKTGVDIEGELPGILPSREWKRKYFSGAKYREEHRRWIVGDQISIGIGQGFNAYTPLQLAHAMAILANNGVVYKPHLVKSIKNTSTGVIRETEPKPTEQLKLKEEHIKVIKDAMVGVNLEGTSASVFKNVSYPNGGKTGTAQVFSLKGEKYEADKVSERLRDHAWFIAFAPVDKPTIALAVLVENGGFGAQAAAPIARAVMDYHQTGKQPDVKKP